MHIPPTPLPGRHRPSTEREARAHMAEREAHYQVLADRLDRRSRLLARGRLAAVGCVLLSLALAVNARGAAAGWWMALGGAVVLVGVLIVRHARVDAARHRALAVATFHRHAQARLHRRWPDVPAPAPCLPATATAADLDVVGPASLLHLLGTAATIGGQRRLESWALGAAFDADTVRARQTAVAELMPEVAFRESFVAAGRAQPNDARRVEAFTRWLVAEPPRWIGAVAWAVVGLTLALWLALAFAAAGWAWGASWPLPLAVGWLVTLGLARHMAAAFAGSSALAYGLGHFVEIVRLIEARDTQDPVLASLREGLLSSRGSASGALARLDRLVGFSQLRHGALLHVIVHSLTFWDLHVWLALLRWRRHHGAFVPRWLDAVASSDALVQLGGLAYLHPEWPFPELRTEDLRVVGRQVGHPLLATDVRVANDVEVGPPGTVLVVTGSNMAGKSTFLRAVGLNVVLARLGAPVCAEWFALPPLRLETCMRTVDSLEQGLSSFMAQLTRLKGVVDAAAIADPPLLYLLDEVLHGTNSEERRIAVQRIVGHLLLARAIGGLTTHDLALTQIPALGDAARHVHFSETFDESVTPPAMTFDYVVRPGPATSRNALKLVQMLGLPDA